MRRIIRMVCRNFQYLILIITIILLLCNLYFISARALGEAKPTVLGFYWAVVMSGSMEPAVSIDDLVISQQQQHYKTGDIITFQNGASLTTHRIIAQTSEGFLTKGDANNAADQNPVAKEAIIGKVILTIPGIGLAIHCLRTPIGLLCFILLGIFLLELPNLLQKKGS